MAIERGYEVRKKVTRMQSNEAAIGRKFIDTNG
jgi:hypothetical protein